MYQGDPNINEVRDESRISLNVLEKGYVGSLTTRLEKVSAYDQHDLPGDQNITEGGSL